MIMYKLTVSCILLTILFVDVSQGKGHLENCVYGNECDGNLNCFPDPSNPNSGATKCRCNFGQIYSPAKNSCQPMTTNPCQNDTQCQDRDLKRVCQSNKCQCPDGQSPDKSTFKCLSKRHSSCQVNEDCPANLVCYQRTKTCLCPSGYVWSRSESECKLMGNSDAYCAEDSDCQDRDQNRVCSNTTDYCICKPGYFVYSSTCTKQRSFGESCPTGNDRECGDLVCDYVNGNLRCRCPRGLIWSPKQAKCLLMSEFRCQTDDECKTFGQNRVCNATSQCGCKQGYYDDARYNECRPKFKLGENSCYSLVQCASNNSMCHRASSQSSYGLCSCLPSHQRSGQVCLQRKCRDDDGCGSPSFDEDRNMICASGKCGCRKGYKIDLDDGTGKCERQSDDDEATTISPPKTTSE